ncbi:MAG TPA: site-2 protease family protein [Anaerolineales bacterium]|nr:site-2 protease family protein [Anaerolineales bacterium]
MLGLDASTIFAQMAVLMVAFPVHEFAHAWTANYFGDDTPRANGRLTLNPLAHLDVWGSILLLVAGFGWAKPVPVNPYALQRRSSSALMWVSLAGPLSNFLLAILAAIPFRLGLVSPIQAYMDYADSASHLLPTLPQLLLVFIFTNLVLMLFNLIPLAPLDGDKIADYFFPPAFGRALDAIRPYGPIILMLVMFVLPRLGLDVVGYIIMPPLQFLVGLLIG